MVLLMTAVTNAIPTRYAGCHFRSRLEARWAVFFDELEIQWDYEPQGFEISWRGSWRRNYLPDFYLPRPGVWVEVRGSEAALDRRMLLAASVPYGGLPADPLGTPFVDPHHAGDRLLVLGPIPHPAQILWSHTLLRFHEGEVWADDVSFEKGLIYPHRWGSALFGDLVGLAPIQDLLLSSYPCPDYNPRRDVPGWEGVEAPGVAEAYEAARSARFEHGQSGPT